MTLIQQRLFELKDEKYKKFSEKLMPTINHDIVIGIRTPVLRDFAKTFSKEEGKDEFLNSLPHEYFEENNLHAFLLEQIKDFDEVVTKTEEFLPYIDNWATCDIYSPKIFKKHPDEVYIKIKEWLKSDKVYTVRFAIGLLLSDFLDDNFKPEMPELVSKIRSEEYYINMMIAWYFATALNKKYKQVIGYIENERLSPWCHNKTIQKAVESYKIDDETKKYLKTLKIK